MMYFSFYYPLKCTQQKKAAKFEIHESIELEKFLAWILLSRFCSNAILKICIHFLLTILNIKKKLI
jgi:hypothetical protein